MEKHLANNRSCAFCYAYDQNQWSGALANRKGFCRLGFNVEQIKPVAKSCGRGGDYMLIFCKPSEPCMKPKTEQNFVQCLREINIIP